MFGKDADVNGGADRPPWQPPFPHFPDPCVLEGDGGGLVKFARGGAEQEKEGGVMRRDALGAGRRRRRRREAERKPVECTGTGCAVTVAEQQEPHD
eukprot:2666709-Rhodomonas_salina.2